MLGLTPIFIYSALQLQVCFNKFSSVQFNTGDLVQREHPKNKGEKGWGAKKPAISPKRCKIGPRLL